MMTLWAAAAGAAAMYFFDPDQGRRRRALVRDKFAWLRDEAGDVREAATGRAEHLRNRATGMAHETRSAMSNMVGAQRGASSVNDAAGTASETDRSGGAGQWTQRAA